LFNTFAGHTIAEVVIGDNSDNFTMQQAADWISAFTAQ
jgi:hypothetical protein